MAVYSMVFIKLGKQTNKETKNTYNKKESTALILLDLVPRASLLDDVKGDVLGASLLFYRFLSLSLLQLLGSVLSLKLAVSMATGSYCTICHFPSRLHFF